MMNANTARTAALSLRWIELLERDLDYPLDGDGCPHMTGRIWLVPVSAIRHVRIEPEYDRGHRVFVHIAGRKSPILICESADWLLAEIRGDWICEQDNCEAPTICMPFEDWRAQRR